MSSARRSRDRRPGGRGQADTGQSPGCSRCPDRRRRVEPDPDHGRVQRLGHARPVPGLGRRSLQPAQARQAVRPPRLRARQGVEQDAPPRQRRQRRRDRRDEDARHRLDRHRRRIAATTGGHRNGRTPGIAKGHRVWRRRTRGQVPKAAQNEEQRTRAWFDQHGWRLPSVRAPRGVAGARRREDLVIELIDEGADRRRIDRPKRRQPRTAASTRPPQRRQAGQVPPQHLEAEEHVLGAMMLAPGAIVAVRDVLDAERFLPRVPRKIYRAALALFDRGEPVDAITLTDELEQRGDLDGSAAASASTSSPRSSQPQRTPSTTPRSSTGTPPSAA
jgi:hypothetical protein